MSAAIITTELQPSTRRSTISHASRRTWTSCSVPERTDELQNTQHEKFRIMGKLSGKVALVTGRASGIGRAIVGALTAEGADIGIVYRNARAARPRLSTT